MKHSVRRLALNNGAQGLLIHVPDAPVMTFDFNFRAGNYLCPPDKIELAHLMEHMVLGANKTYRSAQKFANVFEANGAYNNAYTDAYSINYQVECADFEWERILDLSLIAITQPIFLQSEFDSESKVVSQELSWRSEDHQVVLEQVVDSKSGFVPYTYAEGKESMKNITLADVRNFYNKTHFAANLRFVIAGNVFPHRHRLRRKLEKIDLPTSPDQRLLLPQETLQGQKDIIYLKEAGAKGVYFTFSVFCPEVLSQAERDALHLVNIFLSSGYDSRLYGQARLQGLVYDLNCFYDCTGQSTFWGVCGQVSQEKLTKVMALISQSVREVLAKKLPIARVRELKTRDLGNFYRSSQTIGGLASNYTSSYFRYNTFLLQRGVPARIKSITRQRMLDSFVKLFASESWSLGLLGTVTKANQQKVLDEVAKIWRI